MSEFKRSTALPHLEARRSCQKLSCYRFHTHDSFSIGVIDDGCSYFDGALGGSILLHPGDTILIPAEHVHRCNPAGGRWLYRMIHMDQKWAASLCPSPPGTDLFSGITVLRSALLYRAVTAWSELVFADATGPEIEGAFLKLAAALHSGVAEHSVAPAANADLLARLSPALECLRTAAANPSLEELAGQVGLSKYELIRAVKKATGLTPWAWRHNARIISARQMLRSGRPIAETAIELGFTDQSHFHRVFRTHVAASPGTYRRQAQ